MQIDKEPPTFRVAEDILVSEVAQVKAWYKANTDVVVAPGRPVLGLVDLDTISRLASLLISLVSRCLTIRRDSRPEAWPEQRLKSVVATELLKLNVSDYTITGIANFSALVDGTSRPCTIVVNRSGSNTSLTLYIFQDGASSYSVSLKPPNNA